MEISMVSLDRFAYGLPDPQEDDPEVVASCEYCNEDIYEGDEHIISDVGVYCSLECLLEDINFEYQEDEPENAARPVVISTCDYCGKDIYEGEEHIISDVGVYCSLECLLKDINFGYVVLNFGYCFIKLLKQGGL